MGSSGRSSPRDNRRGSPASAPVPKFDPGHAALLTLIRNSGKACLTALAMLRGLSPSHWLVRIQVLPLLRQTVASSR